MAHDQTSHPRWPGSGSNPTGSTNFGYFDNDQHFINDAPKVASWTARQLGYPVVDVEITDDQIYSAFEEATIEYGAEVNRFNIRENLPHLQGQPLSTDVTGKNIDKTSLSWNIRLSQDYGTEAGAGGDQDWKKTKITLEKGKQKYDLTKLIGEDQENFKEIEVKRVFHHRIPASKRDYYYGGFIGAGGGNTNISDVLDEFGFSGYGVGMGAEYLLYPLNEELQRTQHVELYDKMRRSHYSFRLINNQLEIFPRPRANQNLWLEYIVVDERDNPVEDLKTNSWNFYSFSNNQLAEDTGWITSSVTYRDIDYSSTLSSSLAQATASLDDLEKITVRFDTTFNIDTQNLESFVPTNVSRDLGFNKHYPELNELTRVDTGSDGNTDFYDVSMIVSRTTGSDSTIATGSDLVQSSDVIQVQYNYLEDKQTEDVISDYSNVPYDVIPYKNINQPGRQWIRKYTLAQVKQIVGEERSKYDSIPVPGSEVSLNGDQLKQEGKEEQQELIEKLREDLEQTTRRAQLERSAEEAQNLSDSLKNVPLGIYTG